ncbi:MAG TPA: PfkB family carbohydrate kinase, partial [Actinomycetota bacterium]|nr:PfkB family carbohydrate kinase [Actinomycetota bacterium]
MAVIGHVEWVEFARVDRVPRPGEIVHAEETWEEPAGGGAVAAVQLAKLAGRATLYTAFGNDDLGRKARAGLEALGLEVEAVVRPYPQRRCFVYIDGTGERTITTIGERLGPNGDDPLPWEGLAETVGVYFTAGDAAALRAGRSARVLVATSRILADLTQAHVELDAVVG